MGSRLCSPQDHRLSNDFIKEARKKNNNEKVTKEYKSLIDDNPFNFGPQFEKKDSQYLNTNIKDLKNKKIEDYYALGKLISSGKSKKLLSSSDSNFKSD